MTTIAEWPIETWIAVSVVFAGLITAVATAAATLHKVRNPAAEKSFEHKAHTIRLSDEDRSLIGRAVDQLSDSVRLHRDAIRDHRDAIRDQTSEFRDDIGRD